MCCTLHPGGAQAKITQSLHRRRLGDWTSDALELHQNRSRQHRGVPRDDLITGICVTPLTASRIMGTPRRSTWGGALNEMQPHLHIRRWCGTAAAGQPFTISGIDSGALQSLRNSHNDGSCPVACAPTQLQAQREAPQRWPSPTIPTPDHKSTHNLQPALTHPVMHKQPTILKILIPGIRRHEPQCAPR